MGAAVGGAHKVWELCKNWQLVALDFQYDLSDREAYVIPRFFKM